MTVFGLAFGQTPKQVQSLISILFSNYDKRVRPVADQSLPVILDVSFNLISIIGVDEVNEKLESSGYLTVQWHDAMLTWDPETNDGIERIFVPQNDIWKPDLVLGNGFKKFEEFGGSFYFVDILCTGFVLWQPFQVFESHCTIDTTYFPYDKEVCEIVFRVWSYTVLDVEIRTSSDGVDLQGYKESGVWEITHTKAEVSRGSAESMVTFSLYLKRKPLYFVLNIIVPILFLGLLTILVFVLPVDSGEKMSYAITVFLSFAVFLTIINTQLPVSSDSTSVLSFYLLLQMSMGVLILVITALQIRLHHRDATVPISRVFEIMVKFKICLTCSKSFPLSKNSVGSLTTSDKQARNNLETSWEKWKENKTEWKDVTAAIDSFAFYFFLIVYIIFSVTLFLFIAV
ncbi:neuronal acetylcholine receptor subunit alpha-3-like [Saccostrea echinata]|uniref:neuronal acetylcholine receptor subunit alpha-3-like n=1 Tax=Saccostrea echinata TaxID=191078 RepID=UPI002A82A10E|nr:neuronal acetylcholine receptor subunit alpha-3-like [Saccostrea echinata]